MPLVTNRPPLELVFFLLSRHHVHFTQQREVFQSHFENTVLSPDRKFIGILFFKYEHTTARRCTERCIPVSTKLETQLELLEDLCSTHPFRTPPIKRFTGLPRSTTKTSTSKSSSHPSPTPVLQCSGSKDGHACVELGRNVLPRCCQPH